MAAEKYCKINPDFLGFYYIRFYEYYCQVFASAAQLIVYGCNQVRDAFRRFNIKVLDK